MKIISERQRVETVEYQRCFESAPYCGYAFSCDENGNVFPDLNEDALRNYQNCIDGKYPHLKDVGVRKCTHTYIEPAVGICDNCGREVRLEDEYCGAAECECGEWYTMNGQHINPPEMWEEPIDYEY